MISAQRLTASEVCPHDSSGELRECDRRAQRLTASEVCPQHEWRRVAMFRHRAQRLTASEVCPLVASVSAANLLTTCSTPYGIRGLST